MNKRPTYFHYSIRIFVDQTVPGFTCKGIFLFGLFCNNPLQMLSYVASGSKSINAATQWKAL